MSYGYAIRINGKTWLTKPRRIVGRTSLRYAKAETKDDAGRWLTPVEGYDNAAGIHRANPAVLVEIVSLEDGLVHHKWDPKK